MHMNNEKKLLFTLLIMGILLSGCRKNERPHQPVDQNDIETARQEGVFIPLAHNDSASVSLFDEDIEAFVLEDETDNPHASSMTLAHNDAQQLDFTWEEPPHLKDEIITVNFPYDSYRPLSDQKALAQLTQKAQEMYKNNRIVCCKGHACPYHGTSIYNIVLSKRRADVIALQLEQAGIPKSHIKTFGVGNEEPIVLADSQEGNAPNRRVEIYALAA